MKISCLAETLECTIEGVADFEASNPARGRQESGAFRYSMGIRFVENRIEIATERVGDIQRAE
jgi:hypothetical protein